MGISTSTGTLTAGQSRTFNMSPASAVTLTLSPNVRVTITETPAIVAATGLGGNASRVHEPRLPGVVTYGPYPMGGSVLVEVESNSGSSVSWVRSDSIVAESADGLSSLVDGGGNVVTPKSAAFSAAVPLTGLQTNMSSYVVTGAIAFTVASGAVTGGSATVDLVADGVNTPTFSGMYPTNGSASYLNVAGAINSITFYQASGVTWYSITNNAAAYSETYAVAVTPTALEYMTDSGGGVYTATASGTSNGAKMVIDRYLPANANGALIGTYTTGGDVVFTLGFDTSSSVSLLEGNCDFSIRVSLSGLLSAGTNGAPVSTGITITASADTRLRLRRVSGVITAEYSYDAGATWTVAYTWAGSSTALLNAHYYTTYSTTGKKLVAPQAAGLVPA
ncbi:MAG TPA: hypothetical protein PLE35_01060 [Lentisphaeria bacterium]|nr:hypothetical protein [Lentisphaeria bacterium]